MRTYLDSSAALKLVLDEAESGALRAFVDRSPDLASSALLRAELLRGANRLGGEYAGRARELLASVALRDIDNEVLDRAGEMAPTNLRTLDAIHVATASLLGPDLQVIVTYDRRMIEAARMYGLPVASPA